MSEEYNQYRILRAEKIKRLKEIVPRLTEMLKKIVPTIIANALAKKANGNDKQIINESVTEFLKQYNDFEKLPDYIFLQNSKYDSQIQDQKFDIFYPPLSQFTEQLVDILYTTRGYDNDVKNKIICEINVLSEKGLAQAMFKALIDETELSAHAIASFLNRREVNDVEWRNLSSCLGLNLQKKTEVLRELLKKKYKSFALSPTAGFSQLKNATLMRFGRGGQRKRMTKRMTKRRKTKRTTTKMKKMKKRMTKRK